MNTEELIAAAEGLVKELQGRINGGGMDLQEAEAKILEMVNWIGDAMVQDRCRSCPDRLDDCSCSGADRTESAPPVICSNCQ